MRRVEWHSCGRCKIIKKVLRILLNLKNEWRRSEIDDEWLRPKWNGASLTISQLQRNAAKCSHPSSPHVTMTASVIPS